MSAPLPPDLPRPPDDGAADHLPGRQLPRVALTATDGTVVALDQLPAARTIIYCYPLTGRADVTLPEDWESIPGARGCTNQACDFRDHHNELISAGAHAVFGLSSQSTDYQAEVVERLHLPFPMLADPELHLAEDPQLPTFSAQGMTLYRRQTLVISGGAIEHVFYPVFPPDQHASEVLAWLTAHRPKQHHGRAAANIALPPPLANRETLRQDVRMGPASSATPGPANLDIATGPRRH